MWCCAITHLSLHGSLSAVCIVFVSGLSFLKTMVSFSASENIVHVCTALQHIFLCSHYQGLFIGQMDLMVPHGSLPGYAAGFAFWKSTGTEQTPKSDKLKHIARMQLGSSEGPDIHPLDCISDHQSVSPIQDSQCPQVAKTISACHPHLQQCTSLTLSFLQYHRWSHKNQQNLCFVLPCVSPHQGCQQEAMRNNFSGYVTHGRKTGVWPP